MKKNKIFSILLTFGVIAVCGSLCVKYLNKNVMLKQNTAVLEQVGLENNKTQNIIEDRVVNVSINAIGDLLIHNTVYTAAKQGEDYDFSYQVEEVADKIKDADYSICNLEVPFAGKEAKYSNYPNFNCPEALATTLKDVLDIELATTANNHCLDKGYKGLTSTIKFLDKAGVDHIGTYASQEDADTIFVKEINGARIAFLNYTYGTNGITIPSDKKYCVNLIDKEKMLSDSKKIEAMGDVDYVVTCLHNGVEYQLDANNEQKELAKWLFENTETNLIIGTHPHVVQGIEQIEVDKNGTKKTGTVIYSLGNFLSAQDKKYTDTGLIAKVNLSIHTSDRNKSTVDSIEYTPVFVDRNYGHKTKRYRVVDINKAINDYNSGNDKLISEEEYNKLVKYRDYYRDKLVDGTFVKEI